MKFLVDRCARRRLADWLRAAGHDALESREREPDPGDEALLDWAVQEGCILVTMDKDFGALVFAQGRPHVGIIRLPDRPAEARISLMKDIIDRVSAEDLGRSIVTVRGNRIRLSQIP